MVQMRAYPCGHIHIRVDMRGYMHVHCNGTHYSLKAVNCSHYVNMWIHAWCERHHCFL